MGAQAVEAYLHEWVAPKLLGKDPLAIEARNKDMLGYLGWRGSGVETRGNAAVDITLWDIFGKIAAMADAWQLPVAPHDCTGPVVWAASTHLSLHAPNALIQESVRAFYRGWYQELVTELPTVTSCAKAHPTCIFCTCMATTNCWQRAWQR